MGVFFRVFLFFRKTLLYFWLFLELAGLMLVPCFFLGAVGLSRLLTYVVMSGLASSFIVFGVLIEGLFFLVLLGFLIKLGVFPFFFWVYIVMTQSNWTVVLGVSTFLKLPLLLFYGVLCPGEGFV